VTTYTEEKYWNIFEILLTKDVDTKNIRTQKQLMNIYIRRKVIIYTDLVITLGYSIISSEME